MFADYRVPVVLREFGILSYSESLAQKVLPGHHKHFSPLLVRFKFDEAP